MIMISAALTFFGIYPLLERIKITSDEICEKQAIFLSFGHQDSYLVRLQREYGEIEKEIPLISANFLSSKEDKQVEFIEFLESAANSTLSSLKINVLSPKTDLKEKENSKKNEQEFISFQLEVKNEFKGLMDFLAYLENSEYYIDVISMNIKTADLKSVDYSDKIAGGKNISGGKIIAIFKIKVYVKE